MMQLERQKKILDYLNKNRKATTKELSQLLDVSTTTIRTDLNQMDRENLITKTHGGAVYNDRSLDNIELTGRAYFFDERALENQKEKEAIANKAIKLIKNHMCIYLDASSTCYTLGMKLSGFTKLTVINRRNRNFRILLYRRITRGRFIEKNSYRYRICICPWFFCRKWSH